MSRWCAFVLGLMLAATGSAQASSAFEHFAGHILGVHRAAAPVADTRSAQP